MNCVVILRIFFLNCSFWIGPYSIKAFNHSVSNWSSHLNWYHSLRITSAVKQEKFALESAQSQFLSCYLHLHSDLPIYLNFLRIQSHRQRYSVELCFRQRLVIGVSFAIKWVNCIRSYDLYLRQVYMLSKLVSKQVYMFVRLICLLDLYDR